MASVSTRRFPCTLILAMTPLSATGAAASAAVSPVGTVGASPTFSSGAAAGCCASAAAAATVRVARKRIVLMRRGRGP